MTFDEWLPVLVASFLGGTFGGYCYAWLRELQLAASSARARPCYQDQLDMLVDEQGEAYAELVIQRELCKILEHNAKHLPKIELENLDESDDDDDVDGDGDEGDDDEGEGDADADEGDADADEGDEPELVDVDASGDADSTGAPKTDL